jgi:type II secretory pathway component PulJ
MKFLKRYKNFQENASGSGTAGSGDVTNAIVGNLAGVGSISGSGDISFYLKKQKRKKGDPTKVTDMRDLEPAKGVTKVEEIKESEMVIRPRDPAYDPETLNMINDCLIELYDLDFELDFMEYDIQKHSVDLDDEETGYFSQEELRLSLHKNVSQFWDGNITVNCKFDESGITSTYISTLRARGKSLDENEQNLFDLVEEVASKLINNLEYQSGEFSIQWLSVNFVRRGSSNVNLNVSFTLNNNLKH